MARLRTDWTLFLTILAMTGFGIVMVFSASSAAAISSAAGISSAASKPLNDVQPYSFGLHQIGFAVISFVVLMYFKRLDYRALNTPAWAFSGLGIVLGLLVVVYFVDQKAHRWFKIPGVGSMQPSEFAKPALVLFLAYFISRRTEAINDHKTLRQAFVAVLMLAMLVVGSDLGTAMVPVITAVIVFWVAGLEWKYLRRVVLLCVLLCAIAVCRRGYRLGRVIAYIDPDYSKIEMIDTHHWIRNHVQSSTSVRDASYQPRQSKIAIGTGGVFGVGLMQSKQKLMFLPEAHTDFIYATVGEELGLWGSAAVLFGYVVLLWRGARLFLLARDDFGKYLALGVTVSILLQALLNMTVVLDMAPTKGFPLPLISYGGSSLLSTLASLGMLLSVSEHEG
jgi:cell division protein FtsW